MVCLRPGLPSHIVGILQQLGQAQYPHKRREILGSNLVEGNLHLVAKLVDYPFLVTAQLHGTVKLFLFADLPLVSGGCAASGRKPVRRPAPPPGKKKVRPVRWLVHPKIQPGQILPGVRQGGRTPQDP